VHSVHLCITFENPLTNVEPGRKGVTFGEFVMTHPSGHHCLVGSQFANIRATPGHDVTYDLRKPLIAQVIRDGIAEGPSSRTYNKIVLHSKVLTKAAILVYYLYFNCRSMKRITSPKHCNILTMFELCTF